MNVLTDPTKRRWLAFGALATVFLLVNLHRLSTAVLSEQLTADFGTTAAQLGTLHASFFYIYALIQIPTGVLADRYGPRYVGSAGAAVLSTGAVAFALADGYGAALLSRALIGTGSGVIFVSILRFSANWFRAGEFATMTGLTGAMAGLGAILATTPLALAAEAVGWRPTLLALGAVGFAGGLGVFVFVRKSPADAGLDPIQGVPEQPSVTLRETGAHLRRLLVDLDQWLVSFVFFAAMGMLLTLLGLWGIPYLVVVYGLDVTTASYYTLLGSVGSLFGPPLLGRLSDAIERRILPMVVSLGLLTVGLSIIPVFGKPPLAAVAVAYFLSGLLFGGALLGFTIVKERYPAGASGVATAVVNTAGFVGGALFPTLMGLALDAYRTDEVVAGSVTYTEFGYRVAFGILVGAVAIAFLCSLWLFARNRPAA
ncbi:MFS transporter [Natronomonas gomsonensis]|uniref:MFS transporter n=1 Tax=Natronomonas gomsonensis TaxID=1046043 RepID=UPI0015BB583F